MVDVYRVLVVDDDPNVASMLSDMVETFGYRTATASNAAQALRAVREVHGYSMALGIGATRGASAPARARFTVTKLHKGNNDHRSKEKTASPRHSTQDTQ